MNTILLVAATLALGAPEVQVASQRATQVYVKTLPPGAEITLDGRVIGESDGLFETSAGVHRLKLSATAYVLDERSIEVREGEITRVEVELKRRSAQEVVLSHVADSSKDKLSIDGDGHAVAFQRPAKMKSLVAVRIYAGRYGHPQPPAEDFHVYLLDEDQTVLEHFPIPYSRIERREMRWYTLDLPPVEVPEKFGIALWFNAEYRKGIYLGLDNKVQETHSYTGLPDRGFEKLKQPGDWMVRAVVSPDAGAKPTRPKVTTYVREDNEEPEDVEAVPLRTWKDASGEFSAQARFLRLENNKVVLKKDDGRTVSVPLEQLSQADRDFVAKAAAGETRALTHDNANIAKATDSVKMDHVVVSYDGISRDYAEAIAKIISVARATAIDQFGFDMPEAIKVSVSVKPQESTRLWTDGRDHVTLVVRSPENLLRPAKAGVFNLYGMCHEVGQIAMYRLTHGPNLLAPNAAESWAHYFGSRVVDVVYAKEGPDLWPDRYDYLEDGTRRMEQELASNKDDPFNRCTIAWKSLAEIVGDKGIAPIFRALGSDTLDPADPATSMEKAVPVLTSDDRARKWWNENKDLLIRKRE